MYPHCVLHNPICVCVFARHICTLNFGQGTSGCFCVLWSMDHPCILNFDQGTSGCFCILWPRDQWMFLYTLVKGLVDVFVYFGQGTSGCLCILWSMDPPCIVNFGQETTWMYFEVWSRDQLNYILKYRIILKWLSYSRLTF